MTEKPKIILAKSIWTTAKSLTLELEGGEISIPWENCSSKLAKASEEERRKAELSPGGYGIHWPALDEDLSVGGLVWSRKLSV